MFSIASRRLYRTVLVLMLFLWAAPALASGPGTLAIQLNKLEADGDSCRTYLLLENRTNITFTELRLDLFLFGADGVIERRLAVDAAPLPAEKTSVRVFGINNLACGAISRVLLNDVMLCAEASGPRQDCLGLVALDSLAGVPLNQ